MAIIMVCESSPLCHPWPLARYILFKTMIRFGIGQAVRVLSRSVSGDQVGTILKIINRSRPHEEELYLVMFPDRFMRFYRESELAHPLSPKSGNGH